MGTYDIVERLEEDVRRFRGLADLTREPVLRNAYLENAAAHEQAAEIVRGYELTSSRVGLSPRISETKRLEPRNGTEK